MGEYKVDSRQRIMFENIIGYQNLTEHLTTLVVAREVPSVLLFSGAPVSGKQTIAIELARVMLCEQEGVWNCTCSQCRQSCLFSHQNMVLMGRTSAVNEIVCSKELLLSKNSKRERIFFIRSIEKLIRRADSFLWENSDVFNKTIQAPAKELKTMMLDYYETEKNWYDEKTLSKIILSAQKLHSSFPQQMLPVQCIRNIISWSQINSHHLPKIVIMNHVEEMLPSSANMMLKTLEEPSKNVYFILLTNNSLAVLPTIRSRAREYMLPLRSVESEKIVLKKVFNFVVNEAEQDLDNNTSITHIHEYLDSFTLLYSQEKGNSNNTLQNKQEFCKEEINSQINIDGIITLGQEGIQKLAHIFFHSILHQKAFQMELVQFVTKKNKDVRQHTLLFITYLANCIVALLKDEVMFAYFINRMWTNCKQARENILRHNMGATLVLEILYYKLFEDYEIYTTQDRRL